MNNFTLNQNEKKNNLSPLNFTKRTPVFKSAVDVLPTVNQFNFASPVAHQFHDDIITPPPARPVTDKVFGQLNFNANGLKSMPPMDTTVMHDTELSLIKRGEINYRKSFSSYSSADALALEISNVCSRNNILDVEFKKSLFQGRFFSNSKYTMAQFCVEIYASEQIESVSSVSSSSLSPFGSLKSRLHIVEFRKLSGCSLAFNEFMGTIIDGMNASESVNILFTEMPSASAQASKGNLLSMMPLDLPLDLPPLTSLDGFDFGDDTMSDDVNSSNGDESALEMQYLFEIIDSIESGYAREIANAATLLIRESEKDYFSHSMVTNKLMPRLMNVICNCKDVLLVRSVLIAILNGISSSIDVQNYGMNRDEINGFLVAIKQQWSTSQVICEGFGESIAKSEEIIYQANRALQVFS